MLSIVTNGEKKTLPSAICLEDYISIFKKKTNPNKNPKTKQKPKNQTNGSIQKQSTVLSIAGLQ